MGQTIVIDKQHPDVTYYGATGITGLGSGTSKLLEFASNVSRCSATFGNVNGSGFTIADDGVGTAAQKIKEGTHYAYDELVNSGTYNIYDDNDSGALDPNRYFRIIHGSYNILHAAPAGLGITDIYAKNLQGTFLPPKEGECFVDPYIGKLCLPRPAYRSYMQTIADITQPDLSYGSNYPTYTITNYDHLKESTLGQFNSCISIEGEFGDDGVFNLYPLANPGAALDQGTISVWIKLSVSGNARATTKIYISDATWLEVQNDDTSEEVYNRLYVNSTLVDSDASVSGTWIHYYIMWDTAAGLYGGKSIRIFKDGGGTAYLDSSVTFAAGRTSIYLFSRCKDAIGVGKAQIETTKIWDHPLNDVVNDCGDWEFSSTTGISDHFCYGAGLNYRMGTVKVGYYKIIESSTPAVLLKPGADAHINLDNITYDYGLSVFGSQGVMKKHDYTDVLAGDFTYDTRLDNDGDALYDEDTTTNFAATDVPNGKIARIVHDTKNVTDATGLNLSIYSKNLVTTNVSPVKTDAYIDPLKGIFILPRPSYFCRCETVAELTNPSIQNETPLANNAASYLTPVAGHLGSFALQTSGNTAEYIYPFGNTVVNEGTLSVWINVYKQTWSSANFRVYFGGTGNYVLITQTTYQIYVDGIKVEDLAHGVAMQTGWHHLYVAWSKSGTFNSGKKLQVWLDNSSLFTWTTTWSSSTDFKIQLYVGNYNVSMDNLKIWKELVSPIGSVTVDPDWEFNGGSGLQNAMHEIYGSGSNYEPTVSGMGYHQAGGSGTYAKYSAASR